MNAGWVRSYLRPGTPDFSDLPWQKPLREWTVECAPLEILPIGICRHPVLFVRVEDRLYALKELPDNLAAQEYALLRKLEDLDLPAVKAVGHVSIASTAIDDSYPVSVLITEYLETAVPYRHLFVQPDLDSYREHLLDAIASLLVQLHLSGLFWGDCSLSNTLFKRDAGRLQAYLVDAETSEIHPELTAAMRDYELDLMEENVSGALADLAAAEELPANYPIFETGASIRQRYQQLWDEITQVEKIQPSQHYRIQERIRKLNQLGFSVDEVMLETLQSQQLQFRVLVADRHYHKNVLQNLTGLSAEEQQARLLLNEIQEIRAERSRQANRSTALSEAAQHWLQDTYSPLESKIEALQLSQPALEIYCLMLEHKWFLSEKAAKDVGHARALDDYLATVFKPEKK